jgi:phage baseplate assembly protein W
VPHLAFPLIVGPSGVFDVLQQDTLEEVIQSVTVLLGTNLGDRVMVPSYGVADPTFSQPNPDAIAQAIARWEPRAEALVGVTEGANGTTSVTVQIALATAGS